MSYVHEIRTVYNVLMVVRVALKMSIKNMRCCAASWDSSAVLTTGFAHTGGDEPQRCRQAEVVPGSQGAACRLAQQCVPGQGAAMAGHHLLE